MQKCSTLALNTSSISVCLRDTNHCERIEGKSTQAPNVHETDHPSVAPSVSNKILVEEWRDERIFMVPKPRTGNHKLCCCELMLPAINLQKFVAVSVFNIIFLSGAVAV